MSVPDWDNEGVREGTRKMLDLRARALDRGERPIGWKLGFGAPQSMARFGLSGPLVGFLTDATAHSPGSTVSCAGVVSFHEAAAAEKAYGRANELPF